MRISRTAGKQHIIMCDEVIAVKKLSGFSSRQRASLNIRKMTNSARLNTNWNWLGRYVAVIVVSLILGAALGSMPLFAKTYLISSKLSAGQVARFLGYSTALVAFWILGQQLAAVLRKQAGRWAVLHNLILPAVTLIVVSAMYSVLLLVLVPMLDATLYKI